jgi:hypothetical protein
VARWRARLVRRRRSPAEATGGTETEEEKRKEGGERKTVERERRPTRSPRPCCGARALSSAPHPWPIRRPGTERTACTTAKLASQSFLSRGAHLLQAALVSTYGKAKRALFSARILASMLVHATAVFESLYHKLLVAICIQVRTTSTLRYDLTCMKRNVFIFSNITALLNITNGDHYWENKKRQTLIQLINTLIIAITEK